MQTTELIPYILQNIGLYLWILFCVCASYYFIYRKTVYSLLDPLFIYGIFSSFGSSIVIFMYFIDLIKSKYLVHYAATQMAFMFGFIIISQKLKFRIAAYPSILKPFSFKMRNVDLIMYNLSGILFIVSNLVLLINVGVPLFAEFRNDAIHQGGGWGIFSRIQTTTALVVNYYLVIRMLDKANAPSLRDYLFLASIFVFSLLGGSKSALLGTLGVLFYANHYFLSHGLMSFVSSFQFIKYERIGFGLAIGTAVFVLFLNIGVQNVDLALLTLANRIILSGDIYVNTYPNGVIEYLTWYNPAAVIFQDTLGVFRIVDWARLPETLGIEVFRFLNEGSTVIMGPNPRHNIFGYVYFGFYGSVLYSLTLGLALGYSRSLRIGDPKPTITKGLFYVIMTMTISMCELDIGMVTAQINSLVIVVLPLLLISSYLDSVFALRSTT